MRGTTSRAVDAHLRYLERDGVSGTENEARPILPSRRRPMAGPLWSAVGKIATSFA